MNPVEGESTVGTAKPLEAYHIMTKPVGPICNLDCKYCFYLEKEALFPKGENFRMADDVLESYICQYIASQRVPEVSFAWQGGEPTLLGVEYFEKVVALQRKHANGKVITNAIQTNGTKLDDRWGEFLARNGFLVGISIDGPADLHDYYRVDKGGRPTFEAVERGLGVLKKHGVEFNTLTVVNRRNAREPRRVYRFLKEIGSGFIQFIPLVERLPDEGAKALGLSLGSPGVGGSGVSDKVTHWSVRAEDYGEFLVQIFDEWVRKDVGKVFVQIFDVTLGNFATGRGGLCVFSETCGAAMALEHNGDLYACDHYVYPEYKLGNLRDTALGDMVNSARQRKFGTDKRDTLPRYCRECDVRFACHGECPKHRFIKTPDGEPGLNYLCAAYKRFFHHVTPAMQIMTDLLRQRRAPAEIMDILARREGTASLSRNSPCPCGSGRRYKNCCG